MLSNTPYVSGETRARVLQVVAELDYVPNQVARALSKGRTHIVGVVIPFASAYLFDDPHLILFIRGVEEVLREREYALLLFTATSVEDAASAYRRLIRTRFVDGAIAGGVLHDESIRQELRRQRYPVVALGYYGPDGGANTIHVNDRHGARALVEHLIELGHRRIGLITCQVAQRAVSERVAGYNDALEVQAIASDETLIASGDYTFQSGYAAAQTLLDRRSDLTAIFAVNDRMAMGAIRALRERGVRVPEDVSVVGFDDIPDAAHFDPPLTTVRQPSLDMGRLAARNLLALVDGEVACFDAIELAAELMIRASSAVCREAKG
ncbi:MAG: LacI family DNA-binding transcriptional regulator [Anaerolineae bacterium]